MRLGLVVAAEQRREISEQARNRAAAPNVGADDTVRERAEQVDERLRTLPVLE